MSHLLFLFPVFVLSDLLAPFLDNTAHAKLPPEEMFVSFYNVGTTNVNMYFRKGGYILLA